MKRAGRCTLGLCFSRNRIDLAQLQGGSAVTRAHLSLTEGLSLEHPEAVGAALSELMAEHGIKPGRVAIGLSSRWVLASPRTLPPVTDDALISAVRLQIERDYAGGRDELVFDFTEPAEATGPHASRKLVLMGTQRKRLQAATRVALAAKLSVGPGMPLALAVATNAGGTDADQLIIVLEADGAALVQTQAGKCLVLTSCPFDPAMLSASDDADLHRWAQAIYRNVAALAPAGSTVQLIDTLDLSDDHRETLRQALSPLLGEVAVSQVDPAAAVIHATEGDRPTVDFTRSKLAQKKKRSLPPAAAWGIRAAVLLVLLGACVGYFWFEATSELTELRDEYDTIKDQAERLAEVRSDTKAVSGWYDDRPAVLDCLLELTETFPRRGRIWVTALTLDHQPITGITGTLNCKAQDEATMYQYLNAMKASPQLTNVQLQVRQTTDRQGQTVRFDVTFGFTPAPEDPATQQREPTATPQSAERVRTQSEVAG